MPRRIQLLAALLTVFLSHGLVKGYATACIAPAKVTSKTSSQQLFQILAQQRVAESLLVKPLCSLPIAHIKQSVSHSATSLISKSIINLFNPPLHSPSSLAEHLAKQKQFISDNIGSLSRYRILETIECKLKVLDKQIEMFKSDVQADQALLNNCLQEQAYFTECYNHYADCLQDYYHDVQMAGLMNIDTEHLSRADQQVLMASMEHKRDAIIGYVRGLQSDNKAMQKALGNPQCKKACGNQYTTKTVSNEKLISKNNTAIKAIDVNIAKRLSELNAWHEKRYEDLSILDLSSLDTLKDKISENITSRSYIRAGEKVRVSQARLKGLQEDLDLIKEVINEKKSLQHLEEAQQEWHVLKEERKACLNEVAKSEIAKEVYDPHGTHKARVETIQETIVEDLDMHLNEEPSLETSCDAYDVQFETSRTKVATRYQLQLDKEHRYLIQRMLTLEQRASGMHGEQLKALDDVKGLVSRLIILSALYNKGCVHEGARALNDICFAMLDTTEKIAQMKHWDPNILTLYKEVFTELACSRVSYQQDAINSFIKDMPIRPVSEFEQVQYGFEKSLCKQIEKVCSCVEDTVISVIDAIDKSNGHADAQQIDDLMYLSGRAIRCEDYILDKQRTIRAVCRAPVHAIRDAATDALHAGCHPMLVAQHMASMFWGIACKVGKLGLITANPFAEPIPKMCNLVEFMHETASEFKPLVDHMKSIPSKERFEKALEACTYYPLMGAIYKKGFQVTGQASSALFTEYINKLEQGGWVAAAEYLAYEIGSPLPELIRAVGEVVQQNPKDASQLIGQISAGFKAAEKIGEVQEVSQQLSQAVEKTSSKCIAQNQIKNAEQRLGKALQANNSTPTKDIKVSSATCRAACGQKQVVENAYIPQKTVGNTTYIRGKAFENFLIKKLGARDSFKITSKKYGTREFDGAVGKIWYEAKSGRAWDNILSSDAKFSKFKTDMGRGLKIAQENGAIYELYSNSPIPQKIKEWLIKKNIKFTELL